MVTTLLLNRKMDRFIPSGDLQDLMMLWNGFWDLATR